MKKILIAIPAFFVVLIIGYQIIKSQYAPQYDGEIDLSGIQADTEVYFDDYGIPHIYATSATDAYQTLGYVHAQDRLFQMEMLRRVGTGTLAELLGEDVLDVDKFFRTIGIPQHAITSTDQWNKEGDSEWKSATEAYTNEELIKGTYAARLVFKSMEK
jgi:penicillin amidase